MDNVHARNALVGAWRLVSWENQAADGHVTYPMGTDGIGYVLYAADGRFSITISRRGRAGFTAGDLLSGTTDEQARAMESFVAYAGRYSFHCDRVSHHVELSLFPNWVGSDQQRWVELAGDRLTLSASPLLLAGKQQGRCCAWLLAAGSATSSVVVQIAKASSPNATATRRLIGASTASS